MLKPSQIRKHARLKIYNILALPSLYECEMWAITEQHKLTLWKCGTKVSWVPVCWMIIPGHLEEAFHKVNIAENHLSSLLNNVFTVCNIK
jgi:hypothetical protein